MSSMSYMFNSVDFNLGQNKRLERADEVVAIPQVKVLISSNLA